MTNVSTPFATPALSAAREPAAAPVPTPAADVGEADGISAGARAINLVAVILPFLGLVAAIVLAWGWGFNWLYLGILGGMTLFTGAGITVGFHRLFTHRAFETYA